MNLLKRKILCHISNETQAIDHLCSHFVVSCTNLDTTLFSRLYHLKQENRQLKCLFEINGNNIASLGPKFLIKLTMDYGFDGLLFTRVHKQNINDVISFLLIVSQLPKPYNFDWSFFLTFAFSNEITSCIHQIKMHQLQESITGIIIPMSFLKLLTDNKFEPQFLLVDSNNDITNEIDTIKNNKFGGIYIKLQIQRQNSNSQIQQNQNEANKLQIIYEQLKHSLCTKQNHLEYPTSRFIKDLTVDSIIDAYVVAENVLHISVTVEPIN
jgi:hypothetical protein